MPIYVGTQKIGKVFNGTSEVAEVYDGTTLVFKNETVIDTGWVNLNVDNGGYTDKDDTRWWGASKIIDGNFASSSSSSQPQSGTLGVWVSTKRNNWLNDIGEVLEWGLYCKHKTAQNYLISMTTGLIVGPTLGISAPEGSSSATRTFQLFGRDAFFNYSDSLGYVTNPANYDNFLGSSQEVKDFFLNPSVTWNSTTQGSASTPAAFACYIRVRYVQA